MQYDYDLLILGGGSAGLSLASISARLGVKVALIDAGTLGGDCLHYGCVPSKTLIHSAKIAHSIRTSVNYGIQTAEPIIEWEQITGRIKKVITTIAQHVDNADRFRRMGCDVFTNTYGTFINAHTVRVGEQSVTAKKIAICTGTRPRIIDIPGLQEAGFITNEQIFSLPSLPKELIILGGGPIGVEMAQAFVRLGTKVTILHTHATILQHEDPDVQAFAKTTLEKEGVQFELGWKPIQVTNEAGGTHVTIEKDGTTKIVHGDTLLLAIGRTSNADTINAGAAGIKLTKHGYIVTNNKLQTTVPHIYAAGDVSGHLQFTHSAGYEAGVVLANAILPIISSKINLDNIPWTTFIDPEIASCGLNETRAKQKNIKYIVTKLPFTNQDRALAEGSTKGFIKVLTTKKGTILGCQIVGPHAGELIAEWIIAMSKHMKLQDVSRIVHVYPTLAGINQQVAGVFSGAKFFTPTVRKLLRFFMGYRNTTIETFME